MDIEAQELTLDETQVGRRLDAALAGLLPQASRSYLARLLKDGAILLDKKPAKPSHKVKGGEKVEIEWPEPEVLEAVPEAIPLRVIFEDADLIVIDKDAGIVTHPSAGHPRGTLVNALLGHCTDLSSINGVLRPGIVHRLDRETSGVLVAAKSDRAHRALQEQFAERRVSKAYLALCHGAPSTEQFFCSGRIGRHPTRRTEMAVLRGKDEGREAHTDAQVLGRYLLPDREEGGGEQTAPTRSSAHRAARMQEISLILARPKTGRTHQIRVHLAKAGHPVLADPVYGREESLPALGLTRHALHAWRLSFDHPVSGERVKFEAPLAEDMQEALKRLGGQLPENIE